jgi:hypothetical protein
VLVLALCAMSLDLLVGYCGLVTLGHAAFFGPAHTPRGFSRFADGRNR